jgi:hypothetical protein
LFFKKKAPLKLLAGNKIVTKQQIYCILGAVLWCKDSNIFVNTKIFFLFYSKISVEAAVS